MRVWLPPKGNDTIASATYLAHPSTGVTGFNVWHAHIFLLSQMSTNSVSVHGFFKFYTWCLRRDCHRGSGGDVSRLPHRRPPPQSGQRPKRDSHWVWTPEGIERFPKHKSVISHDPYGRPIQCKCGIHPSTAPPALNLVIQFSAIVDSTAPLHTRHHAPVLLLW